jgi:hypothetical protein
MSACMDVRDLERLMPLNRPGLCELLVRDALAPRGYWMVPGVRSTITNQFTPLTELDRWADDGGAP